ncbi:unnamed protein product [Symbiodinium necroappetens]|uniref:OTU domain-containing protein n=1 Tax=Symbiodinium necroappetens TaxID=1628268 RepID=A0A812UCI8_9DINO|nr:unnamed protein product [Symbiodinium necroappetens]
MMRHLASLEKHFSHLVIADSHFKVFRCWAAHYLLVVTVDTCELDVTNSGTEDYRTGFALNVRTVKAGEATICELHGDHANSDESESFYYVSLFLGFAGVSWLLAIVCKVRRLIGFAGQRVGEASNPGPKSDNGQVAMLISLVQMLIQMVAKLSGSEDVRNLVSQAETAVQNLQSPPNAPEQPTPRRVTVENEWQTVGNRRRGKGKGNKAEKAPSPGLAAGGGSNQHDNTGWPTAKAAGRQTGKADGKAGGGRGQSATASKGKAAGKAATGGKATPPSQILKHDEWELRPDDWHAKLVTADALPEYTGAGESLLVHANNQEEAEVLQVLASGRSFRSSVLIVWRDDEGKLQLPFWQKGRATLHRVNMLKFTVTGVALASLKGARATQKVKAVPTVVIRMVLVQGLASAADWTLANKNLRGFAMGRAPVVKDLWGGAVEHKRGPTLVALVRVDKTQVKMLLQKSGVGGLFWEPLSRTVDETNLVVRWIDANDGETDGDYLLRCLLQKPEWGLVVGRRQLGVRVDQQHETVVRPWRLSHVPTELTQDEVATILTDAGLEHVVLTGRVARKGGFTWFVRAASKHDVVAIPVQQGNDETTLYLLPATPSRQGPANRVPLPRQGTKLEVAQFKVVQKPVDASADAMATGDQVATKRLAVSCREVPEGTKLVSIARDGDCLPASISQAIAFHKGSDKPMPASRMRAEVIAYMNRKKEFYRGFWDKRDTLDEEGGVPDFDAYLLQAAMPSKYWGHLEIAAAAALFNLSVFVIPTDAAIAPTKHGTGAFPVALQFDRGGDKIGHYDVIQPLEKGAPLPAVITNVQEFGEARGGRGGGVDPKGNDQKDGGASNDGGTGDGSEAWTIYTVNTQGQHVPVGRAALGGRSSSAAASATPTSVRRASLAAAFSRGARSSVNAVEEGMPDQAAAAADIANLNDVDERQLEEGGGAAAAEPQRGKRRFGWRCPVPGCGFTCSGKQWSLRKKLHVRQWHPEQRLQLSLKGRTEEPVEVADDIPVHWRCPVCCKAFPKTMKLSFDQLRAGKEAHGAKSHPTENQALFRRRFRPATGVNARKATVAVRAAGLASRLSQIKRGIGAHADVFTVDVPATGVKRKSLSYLVCRRCRYVTHSAKTLESKRCEQVVGLSQQRQGLLKRLRAQGEDVSIDERLRQGARELADFLEPEDASQQQGESAEMRGNHDVEAVPWPQADRSIGIRFICGRCHRMHARACLFKDGTCTGTMAFAKFRESWLRELRPWLEDTGYRGKAARAAKRKLGIEDQKAAPEFPAGLVGGGAGVNP